MSYTIDELKPGMTESFTKTVTEHDVQLFGEISGDTNPLHFDEAFARTTPFKTRIAHGVLSASYLSTVLGMKMPGPGTIFLSFAARFKAPVHIGATVTAVCTVREVIAKKHRVIFDCVCKVGETIVIEGEAVVIPPAPAKA